jgi:hypothetical protein
MSYAFNGHIVTIPIPPHTVGMVQCDQFDKLLVEHAEVEIRQRVAIRRVVETGDALRTKIQGMVEAISLA